ncbi:MAG: hypothetical protein DRQ44_13905 [Gammaproteobacteria bacterium]|nr:MAG: hypothetical protein DRQ44_13905 [Gammaproteobacteria bacterium]
MNLSSHSRLQLTIQKFIFLVLFLSSIGMLAWISNHYNYQFDLTANKRHSLSSSSIDLLSLLNKPVTVHAYTTDDVTQKAVSEIISRYQHIKSDFELRLLNPDIDIEQVRQDGIIMNKPFAFVLYYDGQMELIDSLSETAISNALLRLTRRDDQQVVFLSGHGERDIKGSDNRAYSTMHRRLSDMGFNLQKLNLLENPLPHNSKLVVIAAPVHAYLEGELKTINTYINKGGNLLWLSDPGTENSEAQNLDDLASSLGLQFHTGLIIDNNPDLRQTLNIQHPGIIPVTEYSPHIINNTIRYNSLFPMTRGISPLSNTQTVNNWLAQALFSSAAKSWSESGGISEEMTFNTEHGDTAGPITIAVALTRDASENQNSQSQQRIVVIGDSDFLSDSYIGSGANLNLGLNIFNWLIGDDDFIAIETKASPDTRLDISDTQLAIIGIGFFMVIPLLLIMTGFRIWYLRQKK